MTIPKSAARCDQASCLVHRKLLRGRFLESGKVGAVPETRRDLPVGGENSQAFTDSPSLSDCFAGGGEVGRSHASGRLVRDAARSSGDLASKLPDCSAHPSHLPFRDVDGLGTRPHLFL